MREAMQPLTYSPLCICNKSNKTRVPAPLAKSWEWLRKVDGSTGIVNRCNRGVSVCRRQGGYVTDR